MPASPIAKHAAIDLSPCDAEALRGRGTFRSDGSEVSADAAGATQRAVGRVAVPHAAAGSAAGRDRCHLRRSAGKLSGRKVGRLEAEEVQTALGGGRGCQSDRQRLAVARLLRGGRRFPRGGIRPLRPASGSAIAVPIDSAPSGRPSHAGGQCGEHGLYGAHAGPDRRSRPVCCGASTRKWT